MSEMITLVEAARMLKVTYTIAHGLALRGALDAERFGGHWFVSRKSVERCLAERATEPAA